MDQPAHLTPCHLTSVTGRILNHALYEYGKGVRGLFMITMDRDDLPAALARLARDGIACHVHGVNNRKANLFFGRPALVDCVRLIVRGPLGGLTALEDFMLGTLLGYDREQQCLRFIERAGADASGPAAADDGDTFGWTPVAALC